MLLWGRGEPIKGKTKNVELVSVENVCPCRKSNLWGFLLAQKLFF